MGNDFFQFKQFRVEQEKAAMKVGIDSVVLGSWVELINVKHALDLGTGTGLLSLMIAQRNTDCKIDAIDIDKKAIEQAKINFQQSLWQRRLNALEVSFQDFKAEKRYDLIISNPPYFDASKSVISSGNQRAIARQDCFLSHEEIITGAKNRLSSNGVFALILPFGEISNAFREVSKSYGFHCKRSLIIKPTVAKIANRTVMEFVLNEALEEKHEITIYESQNKYTEQFQELTRDFYRSSL